LDYQSQNLAEKLEIGNLKLHLMPLLFHYLLLINILTLLIFAMDKQWSINKQRRVPEKTLWLLSLIGGSVGGIVAMEICRHKRQKIGFVVVMYLILVVQLIVGVYWYYSEGMV
jgi:uncharacterized membrane protein YsdA (DUF1294 family)